MVAFGELVFTTLSKEALPVVRYRTRDLTRLLPGTARPAFRRMEDHHGRSDDMMIIRGVNVFPSQIEELILKHPELAPHYQCVLGKEGPLDTLTVRVECAHGAVPANTGEARAAGPRHQGLHRRDGERGRAARRRCRALSGQGPPHRRPASALSVARRAQLRGISTHMRPACFMRPAVSPASPAPRRSRRAPRP